ncbi:MAG: flagellar biosynthesis regulator FlaF [Hyphomicrobiaceae bacterium]|nr:flagellar biosynthesis regulator FlaF [Hyphomicrobiaceae bacterium]
MHNQGALAYQQVARQTVSPRDLEADLLSRAAHRLHEVRENWPASRSDLDEALLYNRKIWQVLVTSVTKEDSPLPRQIRQNVANLGIFIFNETRELMDANHRVEKLNSLININRELAAGLRARPAEV